MFLSRRYLRAVSAVLILILLSVLLSYRYQVQNAISYASRPIWDKPDGPTKFITHYYTEGMKFDDAACKLHGWSSRAQEPKVWDAVIVSSEMDLLEIRMNELDAVVDKFFIIESNRTFTGISKPLSFASNINRFSPFRNKIVYEVYPGRQPGSGENAWTIEAEHRDTMTRLLRDTYLSEQPVTPPLVVFSDVDEIPSRHSLQLLKKCQAPSPIHLQMRNFLYSFEWPVGMSSWRASVQVWDNPTTYYRHSKSSEVALADAGWHCSFCFRFLDEFIQKMQGFSHYDRIGGDKSLLVPKNIQRKICEGKDIFDMLPEAYSYKDLLAWSQPEASTTAIGLPLHLIRNFERFRFLLPGGCIRSER